MDNASIASHVVQERNRNFDATGGVVFASNRSVSYDCGLCPKNDSKHKCPAPDRMMHEPGHFTDSDFWEMANADHTTAALWTKTGSVTEALEVTKAMVDKYALGLRDQWDYRDVSRAYGDAIAEGGMRPVVNSHYARQLNMWAIPLALSGQQFDARSRGGRGGVLSFDRREPDTLRRWPVLTSVAMGVATIDDADCAGGLSLRVHFGKLKLRELWLEGRLVATDVEASAASVGADEAAPTTLCASIPTHE